MFVEEINKAKLDTANEIRGVQAEVDALVEFSTSVSPICNTVEEITVRLIFGYIREYAYRIYTANETAGSTDRVKIVSGLADALLPRARAIAVALQMRRMDTGQVVQSIVDLSYFVLAAIPRLHYDIDTDDNCWRLCGILLEVAVLIGVFRKIDGIPNIRVDELSSVTAEEAWARVDACSTETISHALRYDFFCLISYPGNISGRHISNISQFYPVPLQYEIRPYCTSHPIPDQLLIYDSQRELLPTGGIFRPGTDLNPVHRDSVIHVLYAHLREVDLNQKVPAIGMLSCTRLSILRHEIPWTVPSLLIARSEGILFTREGVVIHRNIFRAIDRLAELLASPANRNQ